MKQDVKIHFDLMFDKRELAASLQRLRVLHKDARGMSVIDAASRLVQRIKKGDVVAPVDLKSSIEAIYSDVLACIILMIQEDSTLKLYKRWSKHPDTAVLLVATVDMFMPGAPYARILSNRNLAAQMYHCVARLYLGGTRLFEVTLGLAERLRYTDLTGLRVEDLQLPYPEIYMQVPKELGFKVFNDVSGWHSLVGLYVLEELGYHDEDCFRALRVLACGEWSILPSGIHDDAVSYWTIWLFEGSTLEQSIQRSTERMVNLDVRYGTPHTKQFDEHFKKMEHEWPAIFKWLVNVLVYSTSVEVRSKTTSMDPKADKLKERVKRLPKGGKRDRALDELRRVDNRRKIVLGFGTKRLTDVEARSGRRLMKRFLRMGHYRQQAHGPGRRLRRQMWISPHWVGPTDGEQGKTEHVVK